MRSARGKRWRGLEGFPRLRELLCMHWDPLGLADDPEGPDDEYDSYLPHIAQLLQAGSREPLLAFVLDALRDRAPAGVGVPSRSP